MKTRKNCQKKYSKLLSKRAKLIENSSFKELVVRISHAGLQRLIFVQFFLNNLSNFDSNRVSFVVSAFGKILSCSCIHAASNIVELLIVILLRIKIVEK